MIDGHLFLGRNPRSGISKTAEGLIEYLDRNGLSSALVSSYQSIFYDWRVGNLELLATAKKYPSRILPTATIGLLNADVHLIEKEIDEIIKNGFLALSFHIYPSYYRLQTSSHVWREIVSVATQRKLPVLVSIETKDDLCELCDTFEDPETQLLVHFANGRGYYAITEILAVLKKHPKWKIDISSINNSGGIQYLVEQAGSHSFFFASGYPEAFESTAHLNLLLSGCSDEELEQIYSKTLCEVLNLSSSSSISQVKDSCLERAGAVLSAQKIDTHWHNGTWNMLEPNLSIDKMQDEFKKYNYKYAIFSSIRSLNYDLKAGNADLAKIIEEDLTDRVRGHIVVNPLELEQTREEVRHYVKNPKFLSLKTIQDLYDLTLADEEYRPILDIAREEKLPILAHIPGMAEAAKEYPDVTFICAHATWSRVKHMIHLENIFFDLTTSHNNPHETALSRLVNEAPDRILFGSDGQLIAPIWTLAKLVDATLSEDLYSNIFLKNPLRAFPRLAQA